MPWRLSHRADPVARRIADRHYNRQKLGTSQFVPPGRCLVLIGDGFDALWVTSWPFGEYVKHAWPGAWVCSAFRRENGPPASTLIRSAVAATCAVWAAPRLGMITFLDRERVRPIKTRGVETWGRTWALAGFRHVGATAGGLMAWQLRPDDMPDTEPALGTQERLFA